MTTENKNIKDNIPFWSSPQSLGYRVKNQHGGFLQRVNKRFLQNHLGHGSDSLSSSILRRYQGNVQIGFNRSNYPLVNFFSRSLAKQSAFDNYSLPSLSSSGNLTSSGATSRNIIPKSGFGIMFAQRRLNNPASSGSVIVPNFRVFSSPGKDGNGMVNAAEKYPNYDGRGEVLNAEKAVFLPLTHFKQPGNEPADSIQKAKIPLDKYANQDISRENNYETRQSSPVTSTLLSIENDAVENKQLQAKFNSIITSDIQKVKLAKIEPSKLVLNRKKSLSDPESSSVTSSIPVSNGGDTGENLPFQTALATGINFKKQSEVGSIDHQLIPSDLNIRNNKLSPNHSLINRAVNRQFFLSKNNLTLSSLFPLPANNSISQIQNNKGKQSFEKILKNTKMDAKNRGYLHSTSIDGYQELKPSIIQKKASQADNRLNLTFSNIDHSNSERKGIIGIGQGDLFSEHTFGMVHPKQSDFFSDAATFNNILKLPSTSSLQRAMTRKGLSGGNRNNFVLQASVNQLSTKADDQFFYARNALPKQFSESPEHNQNKYVDNLEIEINAGNSFQTELMPQPDVAKIHGFYSSNMPVFKQHIMGNQGRGIVQTRLDPKLTKSPDGIWPIVQDYHQHMSIQKNIVNSEEQIPKPSSFADENIYPNSHYTDKENFSVTSEISSANLNPNQHLTVSTFQDPLIKRIPKRIISRTTLDRFAFKSNTPEKINSNQIFFPKLLAWLPDGTGRKVINQNLSRSLNQSGLINSSFDFPLSNPFILQRKENVPTANTILANEIFNIQRQENVINSLSPVENTVENTRPETRSTSSEQHSEDELFDKVWRKLMRKITNEQERLTGSRRWLR